MQSRGSSSCARIVVGRVYAMACLHSTFPNVVKYIPAPGIWWSASGRILGFVLSRQRNIYREMAHMRNTRRRRVATLHNTDFEVRSKFRRTCFILCGAVGAAGDFYFWVFFVAVSDKHF